ncbi:MAG: hypothetical protein AB7E31_02730 [Desulfitobacterium sp.]
MLYTFAQKAARTRSNHSSSPLRKVPSQIAILGSMAGWKRPVSNLSPLQAFREERVAARFEVALFRISKSLGQAS